MGYFYTTYNTTGKMESIKINQMQKRRFVFASHAYPFSEFAMQDEAAGGREFKLSAVGMVYLDLYRSRLAIWIPNALIVPIGKGIKAAYSAASIEKGGCSLINAYGKKKEEIQGFHNIDLSQVSSNNGNMGLVMLEGEQLPAMTALMRWIYANWQQKHIASVYSENKNLIDALCDVYLYNDLVTNSTLNKHYRQRTLETIHYEPARAVLERAWDFPAPELGSYANVPEIILDATKALKDLHINIARE